jgi:endonuclease/exonuclease/phosphatase family metal-dependent hydrolase
VPIRVLSWNLYHGRDFPPDPALMTWRSRLLRVTERDQTHAQENRSLLDEFAGWLAGRDWDVALLQEAPPRWFRALALRSRANGVRVLTSRNWCPSLQRRLADWNPDLLASWEGGSNQLLVRHPGRILEHRRLTLAYVPEQRRMQAARLELPEGRIWVANLHASAGRPELASAEVLRAAEAAVAWSGGEPLIFGGDFNLRPRREPEPFAVLRERFGLAEPTAPGAIDHVLVRGLAVVECPRRLDSDERELSGPDGLRIRLSDHAPMVAAFAPRVAHAGCAA